ncbi:MAG: isoaspartyl peptidase/L-asparaginase [Alphaproteobacteria bacterium]|nr:isoaspartyl peptidase/L-asparaginase [Alphaproteobacteria bacterium]MBU1515655.1 isoaspartyl peptidase/L-asparaginase [Alphaproteobacteria bacterium]MBU2094914.1 isoaspartyl peptidase/L-asparaginase [Alphaproteobacteria bacterium]MBU2150946.1 isoaspartyl peptidase/L-asparaginase [Alphaproteobacteria bacterium]MBU2305923.1 isoaspartyl peptidase/L-asparaginase [Alphaproteobacteria bacterium]
MADPIRPKWALVAHGGAGAISREQLSAEQEAAYRDAMSTAAEAGAAVLRAGGSAMDAVEATIHILEDDPLFNAGRGAAFTAEGRNELDASIMDGETLRAGAVAGVTTTRHPISAARAVIDGSAHVMLGGEGADAFARSQGLEQVDPSYFFTERRWRALEKGLARLGLPIPARPVGVTDQAAGKATLVHEEGKHGTVGVVARDALGNVAAGTSTGGSSAKRWGRVGDSPIIGAGTYASNKGCAVSCTGAGEYFIRLGVAHEINALVQHKSLSLQAAADHVIQDQLTALGGDGGVICVAPDGQMAWSFNTSGMYRARIADGAPLVIGVYKDDA